VWEDNGGADQNEIPQWTASFPSASIKRFGIFGETTTERETANTHEEQYTLSAARLAMDLSLASERHP
jgi:hypothetical protein